MRSAANHRLARPDAGNARGPVRQNLLRAELALIGAIFIGLTAASRSADAACSVTTGGIVDCNAATTTTGTTNINGTNPVSSDRQQRFDNGAAINATVQSGVPVDGFGLQLTQKASTPRAVTLTNEGKVTTNQPVNAVELDGNGGPITYLGGGSVTNTDGSHAALSVVNVGGGNVSIATGAGAITGATGINASTTGNGALSITTGSGSVSGTGSPPKGGGEPTFGQGILASTESGPLSLTIGSGGVTSSGENPAIKLTSSGGDISLTANGNVNANGHDTGQGPNTHVIYGIQAVSSGLGNITIGGSGTVSGTEGRGIYALQNGTGLGGITITGTGDTTSGTTGLGCCSTIRAEISNPASSNNITIDRSGNVFAAASGSNPVMSAIHALTAGTGDITVATGAGATITNASLFGIDAAARGQASSGHINVATGVNGTLNAASTGLFADNSAFAIAASAGSTITVTNNGTINSGNAPVPVGQFIGEGGGAPTNMPAGIMAGYNGGPVIGPASGPFTSCGFFGCTTLTPNPAVNGTVSIVNNAAINAAGGDGIFGYNFGNGAVSVTSSGPITVTGATSQNGIEAFSAEVGNISVTTMANVTTSNGDGIHTNSAGQGTTTINVIAGTVQGGTSGITAESTGGAIQINNSGTIENLSAQPGDLAVATSGAGDASLSNNAGAIVTGTVAMTGAGANNFSNAGIWNTLGASTFAGSSSLNNSGTINVFGATTFSGLTTLTNGGTLNLAAGSTIAPLTISGNLAFQSGALYIVALNPTTSSSTNVGGTASLAGAVQAVLLPGAYSKKTYTILHSAGLGGTSFSGFSSPGFSGTLTYTPTDVLLSLAASLGTGGGLNANQQNVASAINNFFNNGGTLPASFMPIFGLSGGNLANALSQIDGEAATGGARGAFQLMTQFLTLMLDPSVDGRRSSGGTANGFAPEQQASFPPDISLAYASVLKASPKPVAFEQRWAAWGSAYGGSGTTNGDPAAGTNNITARTYGFAAGMDYHFSPDAAAGFALAVGGTNWSLAQGLGGGRSDAFQAGVNGTLRSGPAYIAAALAFANHWMTTNRIAFGGDQLDASFNGQSYAGRVEVGYRYAALPTIGVTPYAALQAQSFRTPSYSEIDPTGGGFGLAYNAATATATRSEFGARFDAITTVNSMPIILRQRVAWAHDWVSNPALTAAFQALPATSFIVNGAAPPKNLLLASAGAELHLSPRVSLAAKFDGEFASRAQSYAGTATLRYAW